EHDPHKGMQKGHLDFALEGAKLKGRWHLVRMRKRPGERQEPWLLIKSDDEYARTRSQRDILDEMPDSAATGRTMEEIAGDKNKVWHSNKKKPPTALERIGITKALVKTRRAELRVKAPAKASKSARVPDFIPPELATLVDTPPSGKNWLHE